MTNSVETRGTRRRTILAAAGATASTALAGCLSGGSNDSNDGGGGGDANGGNGGGGETVAAGPNGDLVFEAEEVTISTGETVTWTFESPAHNVSAWPDMHEKVSVPDGASGFGTMEKGGDKFATVAEGETFEHTFETTGEYTYVCVPHATSGMIGTVIVE